MQQKQHPQRQQPQPRTQQQAAPAPVATFSSLRLLPEIQKALHALSFEKPTPIQAQAIPVALEGRDVVATAQTGTGKTAAFCIPMLTRLVADPAAFGLVLVPTRELALQVQEFWKELTRFTPRMNAVSLIGGAPFGPQVKFLRQHARVVIATPGRLIDHLERRTIQLSSVRMLVLDEADRMLDMGFAPQLTAIMKHVPSERQTMLFSATWDTAMQDIAKKYLAEPWRVAVGEVSRAASTVQQKSVQTSVKGKNDTLLDEINRRPEGSMLIFARTQSRTDRLARFLDSYGLHVGRIHGGRTQGQRNTALSAFKTGKTRILVATDIAARGIDVADIAYVVNYDLPMVAEDYVHRIGRTGRAGTTGEAISLLTPEDRGSWQAIVRLLKKSGSALPQEDRAAAAPGGAGRVAQDSTRATETSGKQGAGASGHGGPRSPNSSRRGNRRPGSKGGRRSSGSSPSSRGGDGSAARTEISELPWRPKYRDTRSY